jgi:Flp pilus assembly protein TadD/predicted Ser/Thr protein kinase
MTLESGARLGPYEIVSLLGRGGMGEVYMGRDTRLERSVAVKVLPDSLSKNPRLRKRLEREARIISQLQHPHICTLHDVGSQEGVQYIVMEYLEGESLEERLRNGPLPVEEVLRIGSEIGDAIEAAHRAGVVHRDLKPANIILSKTGTKVLDFGLAKNLDAEFSEGDTAAATATQPLTGEDAIVGTLPYMAPEQLDGKAADARTDIWALGCVLYEMATGKRPFRGEGRASLISAIMRSKPEPVAMEQPLAPGRLDWVVSRCLEKDPEERWQSARDLSIELGSITEESGDVPSSGAGTPLTRPLGPAQGATWTRQWRLLWIPIVLLAIAAIASWQSRDEPDIAAVAPGLAVAVLPFENLTGNDQLGYVGLGLAAGLISQLSELPAVNVVGRSRSWSTLETARSSAELAEQLGVSALVEGEVHDEGGELRVDVATTDGTSAVVLWSGSFRGSKGALQELQAEIVHSLARVLSAPLTAEQRRRFGRGGPSAQAFDYYLQGIERMEQSGNPRHLEFAADLFRHAIRMESEVAVFHSALSEAVWRLSQEDPSAVDPEEAEREARKALALDPELPAAQVSLARTLRSKGRYAESIASLRPLLAEHPKPDEAFRELAFGYRQAGDLAASGECLENAVALAPENWFNWNALGVSQAFQGDTEAARSSLEEAVRLAPEAVTWPLLNLGGVKLMEADWAGAIEDFEAAQIASTSADLTSNIGTAYFHQGELEKAADQYRRAVSLDPQSHRWHRNLGDALLELERKAEASAEFRTALELVEGELVETPQDNSLVRSRALYAAKSGDCETAAAHAETARSVLPKNWRNQLPLASAFALCGRRAEALEAVRACVESGLPGKYLYQQAELASLFEDTEFLELAGPAE